MKLFRKLLLIMFIFIVIAVIVLGIIGFTTYSKALDEKPLITRTNEITKDEHYVPFSELSEDYIHAVVSVEDRRYYEHGAVDFIGIARAIWTNIRTGKLQEGGSTITQQVAKNIVFTQEETITRKMGEIFAAIDLENKFSKDEIFALYVNSAYFGDGYYGIYDASMGYYKKEPKDLTLDEASMLAGVPNAPSVYAPTVNPKLANERQSHVLDTMVENGYISQGQADEIINSKKTE